MTLSMAFSFTSLNILTLSLITQTCDNKPSICAILSATFYCYSECCHAEFYNAACRFAQCHYAEGHGAIGKTKSIEANLINHFSYEVNTI